MRTMTKLVCAALCGGLQLSSLAAPLMSGPLVPNAARFTELTSQLVAQRGARGLDQDHGFVLVQQHPGVAGTEVVRTVHTYKGVPVFGSESVLVVDPGGTIVAESASERRQYLGKGKSNKLRRVTGDFNVVAAISGQAAIAAALATVTTRTAGVQHIKPAVAELIIYPMMRTRRVAAAAHKPEAQLNALDLEEVVDHYALGYLVHTRLVDGDRPLYHDTVVDARSAAILDQWNMLQTVVGVGNSQYNGQVPVSTTATQDGFQMIDPERGVKGSFGGMAITNADHGSSAGKVYTSATNTWGDGKQYINGGSTIDANGQTAAVNALWGLMNTYDMLKNVLGWQSLDGNNTATYIAAHVNTAYDNAYYSDTCTCMFIGDGSFFNSLGAIDVIGHEMGHGVTAATSNLVYSGESGGLNESSSDISGEAVEAYARAGGKGDQLPASGNDWMLGTEISKNGEPLRWMVKPSRDGASPDAWSRSLKRLDVHYSSGPNNRMFYFLAQGSNADKASDAYSKYLVKQPAAMHGIGLDKAYRIWFKAATTKFTSKTNYATARSKMLEAAQELYGKDSAEAIAVQRAYAAINVGADVAE
ncbi:M4 family metallopeptidase [Massilia sp. S19_KUP03_FR1]|uniref:M4 family metallopeptidase n=1 Tax=Massilia sp. S19_KUP03_FR1 TaxID=3025503 RepID=UPI003FA5BD13